MVHSMCRDLLEASKALLRSSNLVHWDGQAFVATHPAKDDSGFEEYARTKFDHEFGRYMCWLLFSVAAENLAKAACVCNGIGPKKGFKPRPLPYPKYKVSDSRLVWVKKVLSNTKAADDASAEKHDYHPLERYWDLDKHPKAYFVLLCKKCQVPCDDRKLLTASYKYLTQAIRNRDAHTYIMNTRKKDFPAVKPIFVPTFNVLVATMQKNGHPI